MKIKSSQWLCTLVTVCAAMVFAAGSSYAETPKSSDENNSGQTMYPGMGPGMMGYGGMGPGYQHPEGMGPGYMGRGGMGYGYGMGYGHMGMMMGGGMGMMYGLNLDKTQRSKLRSLMREQRDANCKTMTQMMDVHDELAAEYDKDKPDAKAIGKLYNKMAQMRSHMIEQSVQMHNKIRGLLNKEQKEIYDRMYHGRMGGYGGMMGPGMMGPGMMGYDGMWNMME